MTGRDYMPCFQTGKTAHRLGGRETVRGYCLGEIGGMPVLCPKPTLSLALLMSAKCQFAETSSFKVLKYGDGDYLNYLFSPLSSGTPKCSSTKSIRLLLTAR